MLHQTKEHAIGYQISHDTFFESTNVNNAGDPFSSNQFYQLHSHEDERALVNRFAYDILKCEPGSMWGYCGSGSTESILNGLWMARKRFQNVPTVYASSDCHFSVPKAADILCMPFVSVPVDPENGTMDLKLMDIVKPAVLVLTLGTTIRNAYDNPLALPHDMTDTHIHVDAAFGGAVYPWIVPKLLDIPFDTFNVSFHKFWGSPYPCSLFLVKKTVKNNIQGKGCFGKDMVCLPDKDFTLSCSRNGTVVSMVKELITSDNFFETHLHYVKQCFKRKYFFVNMLANKLPDQRFRTHPYGLSVELFELPRAFERIAREKYSMSVRNKTDVLFDSHLYVCSHVTENVLRELIDDIGCCLFNENPVSMIGHNQGDRHVKTE